LGTGSSIALEIDQWRISSRVSGALAGDADRSSKSVILGQLDQYAEDSTLTVVPDQRFEEQPDQGCELALSP
jgi:hypothetical protein